MGVYPELSLKEAREKHLEARRLLADGIDPSAYKQSLKQVNKEIATNSFESIACEWHSKQLPKWATSHAEKTLRRLETNVFPWLGSQPITQITPPDVLKTLRYIEERGAIETAHRVLQICRQVFCYAVVCGKAESDPCRDLRGALSPVKITHHPAITNPAEIVPLMQAINGYQGEFITRCAIRLLPLVFTRPGELRNAEWSEIDLEGAL